MDYLNQILESEEYVPMGEGLKATLEYKVAHAVKEEIRKHKWNRGTEGVEITWDQAVDEWMDLYYEGFNQYIKSAMFPKKHMSKLRHLINSRSYESKPFHISL